MEDTVVVEKVVNAPVSKVWEAITDRNKMKLWYFDLKEFEPEPGFEFSFHGQGRKGEQYIHKCKITEVIPMQKLQYTWRYENYEGNSTVTFELSEENSNTHVRLTHRGLASFPKEPDFAVASFTQGWTELITKHLPEYLSKQLA